MVSFLYMCWDQISGYIYFVYKNCTCICGMGLKPRGKEILIFIVLSSDLATFTSLKKLHNPIQNNVKHVQNLTCDNQEKVTITEILILTYKSRWSETRSSCGNIQHTLPVRSVKKSEQGDLKEWLTNQVPNLERFMKICWEGN